MALVVILVLAWAIAKTITNYKIDHEYARQGLESPRMRAKLDQAVQGQISPEAAHRTRPGASGYFHELWDDAWDDASQRHRERRAARKAGTKPPGKSWWKWLFDPIGGDRPTPTPPPASPEPQMPGPHFAPPWSPPEPPAQPNPKAPPPPPQPTTPQPPDPKPDVEPEGDTMQNTNSTGDVHDVETCDAELGALILDLDHIDNALDALDQYVRSARTSAEMIQAFLAGKNVDGEILAGLNTALEMLGPEAIKTLIDAVAAAKQGVANTQTALAPLREAGELVGAADGSVLNGR